MNIPCQKPLARVQAAMCIIIASMGSTAFATGESVEALQAIEEKVEPTVSEKHQPEMPESQEARVQALFAGAFNKGSGKLLGLVSHQLGGGLLAAIFEVNGRPELFWVDLDRSLLFYGQLTHGSGRLMSQEVNKYWESDVEFPRTTAEFIGSLESVGPAAYLEETGKGSGVLYVLSDLTCPYCRQAHEMLQKIPAPVRPTIRWIPVSLYDSNVERNATVLTTGRVDFKSMDRTTDPAAIARVRANTELANSTLSLSTPLLIWKRPQGYTGVRGAPTPDDLIRMLQDLSEPAEQAKGSPAP